jgi:intein-encoded DNA endonuclease-like protein
MVEVIRQRPMSILHPYTVEVYVAVDGSEACLSLTTSNAFCARSGTVRVVKLELEFKRYETYENKTREVTDQKAYWPTPRRRKNT